MSFFGQTSTLKNDAVGHTRAGFEQQHVTWPSSHQGRTKPEGFLGGVGLEADLVHLLSRGWPPQAGNTD